MSGHVEICDCGHDKATHFTDLSKQPREVITCLANGCTCTRYAYRDRPKPKKTEKT